MAAMKITVWPKYQRTGSPTVKAQRRVEQVAGAIFAELLPRHAASATPPSLSGGNSSKRARTRK